MSLLFLTKNEDHIIVGGINLWESFDGGITWDISGSSGNSSDYSYICMSINTLSLESIKRHCLCGK